MPEMQLQQFRYISPSALIALGADQAKEDDCFYYFYHIPKCGGMDTFTSFQSACQTLNKLNKRESLSGRGDDFQTLEGMKAQIKNVAGIRAGKLLGIFASHLGKPAFDYLFPESVFSRKICFIRDPFERAISDYTYQSMRSQRKVSENDFKHFMHLPENINKICKSLLPDEQDFSTIENFVNGFYIFTLLEKQNQWLQYLLDIHGLPNVFREPVNATLPQYRLDTLKKNKALRQQFYKINTLDQKLYERIKHKAIEPTSHITKTEISQYTVLSFSQQSEEQLKTQSLTRSTMEIYRHLQQHTSKTHAAFPSILHYLSSSIK